MSKPVNKHPYRLGNEHGEIRFGHIIKEKQFGYYVRTGDDGGRHYIRMRTNGDVKQGQKGSTNFHSPGSFTIDCGEDVRGVKSADGSKVVNPPAFNLLAQNGDVTISAPQGTIKLVAQNIELIAEGNDGPNGNIILDSNEKIKLTSPDIEVNSSVATKIVSENIKTDSGISRFPFLCSGTFSKCLITSYPINPTAPPLNLGSLESGTIFVSDNF